MISPLKYGSSLVGSYCRAYLNYIYQEETKEYRVPGSFVFDSGSNIVPSDNPGLTLTFSLSFVPNDTETYEGFSFVLVVNVADE